MLDKAATRKLGTALTARLAQSRSLVPRHLRNTQPQHGRAEEMFAQHLATVAGRFQHEDDVCDAGVHSWLGRNEHALARPYISAGNFVLGAGV